MKTQNKLVPLGLLLLVIGVFSGSCKKPENKPVNGGEKARETSAAEPVQPAAPAVSQPAPKEAENEPAKSR